MLKMSKKLIALLLVFSLLISFPVYAEEADIDSPIESEAVRVAEVEALRETNSETYLMSDGTYQCVVYAEDKYYLDDNDSLQRIDNTIVLETASSGETPNTLGNTAAVARYKNAANAFDVRFSSSGVPEISIAKDGSSVTFSPLTATKGNSLQINAVASPIFVGAVNDCAALGQLTATGSNTVTYRNAFTDTDLIYVLENSALKEYIILRDSGAASQFSFLFTLDGLALETADDNVYLTDTDGNIVFALSNLFAIDANGVVTENLSYGFTPVKGTDQIIVTVTLDENYLQTADRAFPVIIDPTHTVVGPAETFVAESRPTTNYNSYDFIAAGYDSTYGRCRSYIKFSLPLTVEGCTILSAALELELESGAPEYVKAYRCTGNWTPSSITWNNKPGYTTTNASSGATASGSGTWYAMTVTDIVQCWTSGSYENYGFVLASTNESNANYFTSFYTSEMEEASTPRLCITYSTASTPTVDTWMLALNLIGIEEISWNSYFDVVEAFANEHRGGTVHKDHFTNLSKAEMIRRMKSAKVLFIGTHGTQNSIQLGPNISLTSSDLIGVDLSNLDFVMLMSCSTGKNTNLSNNTVDNFMERLKVCGAKVVIGFNRDIDADEALEYGARFAAATGDYYDKRGVYPTARTIFDSLQTHDNWSLSVAQYAELVGQESITLGLS